MRGQHLPVKLRLGMNYRPRHPRFKDGLPDTRFWQVGSCICVLLLGGRPKGPYLGEVSMLFKKRVGP